MLIKAVQDYYDKLGIHYEESDILITTGGSEALQMLMLSILDDGSEVIIPEPFYPNYNTFIKSAGGTIRPLTTSPEGGYRYAFREKLEALINENTRAIMFTNPGNPTGVVLTHEELRTIADVAKEHNLFVIGDEVYREFVYGGEQLATIGQFEDINENAVIIDSVSKRFSACGARIGTIITRNKELQQNLMKFSVRQGFPLQPLIRSLPPRFTALIPTISMLFARNTNSAATPATISCSKSPASLLRNRRARST